VSRLIDPDDCALVLVDVQEGFLARLQADVSAGVVGRIAFLVHGAAFCRIPVVATVETPADWGGLPADLLSAIGDAPVIDKVVFGLADDPAAGPAVRALRRGTVVLVGMETDVCVAQSALGLLDQNLRVVVVEDAVASPGRPDQGLERMRRAGATLLSTKQLHYEWMRTVERSRAFTAAHPGLEPPGVIL
jgi:nicotinamidase-related amidase